MNTIVQAIPGYQSENVLSVSPFGNIRDLFASKKFLLVFVLTVAIMISSLSIVYVQAQNRLLFSQLSHLQKVRDNLHVEWWQLLLEQSTWSTQARVQQIAEQALNMTLPEQKNIIIVQQ